MTTSGVDGFGTSGVAGSVAKLLQVLCFLLLYYTEFLDLTPVTTIMAYFVATCL